MSINNYEEIGKDIFVKDVLSRLKNGSSDKTIIEDNYILDVANNKYNLKSGLDGITIQKIQYILILIGVLSFSTLEELAKALRSNTKKVRLLFAHNGIGKTRLSMEFKELGKHEESRDTLYFNAFTEDLFHWDNDLENDINRKITLNKNSRFFAGLDGYDMENLVRSFLDRYANFDFEIDTTDWEVKFSREGTDEDIKISRGEENIFIWSFFLAVAQLAIDKDDSYSWVKYIYIDDPISSLDDNNVITVASHLAKLIKDSEDIKFIISTHHGLFYNVIFNELGSANKYLLKKDNNNNRYMLESLKNDTPFYQHIAILKELHIIKQSDEIHEYHFNLLRNILEKTAAFLGLNKFSDCLKDDGDEAIHARRINALSHGNYSVFDPIIMSDEDKEHFKTIFNNFIEEYNFNEELFPIQEGQA